MSDGSYFRGEPLEVGTTPQFLFDDHAVEDVWASSGSPRSPPSSRATR